MLQEMEMIWFLVFLKELKWMRKTGLKAARLGYVGNYTRLGNSCWFTSIEHGRRHEPLSLMSMADNLRFSKHKELKGKAAYDRYDNYDAIEVPFYGCHSVRL